MNQPITLPQAMLKRLEKISTASRRSPQAIVKQAISDRLEYEEWVLQQIDAGLADINAGRQAPAGSVPILRIVWLASGGNCVRRGLDDHKHLYRAGSFADLVAQGEAL